MKKYFVLAAVVIAIISAAACSKQEHNAEERIKPVRTVEVQEQVRPAVLSYSGIVSSGKLKNLTFKSSGKIKRIYVEAGKKIFKGDVLAELEDQDLQYALSGAKGLMGAAQASYDKAMNGASAEEIRNAELNVKKAKDAYDYAITNYKRAETLFESGAISKSDEEKLKLEADIREAELNQAEELLTQVKNGARIEDKNALYEQLEQAKADYEYKASLVKDSVMTADEEGYIVDILYEEGEMAASGYPVVVVRNEEIVVNVGLAEEDLGRVIDGARTEISAGESRLEGVVRSISQVPDFQTRTYNVEIALKDNSLNLGAIVKVDIIAGEEKGIWIPLTSMLSDGTDYVYLVKNNSAEKREITIEGIRGSMARVKGIVPGERLVVEGMKRLNAGDGISVIE